MEGGLGEWHYPDGSAVGSSVEGADSLYVSRDQMSISLNHRGDGTSVPSGVYCCVVPTTVGVLTSCIKISKFGLIYLFHLPMLMVQFCLHRSFSESRELC